MEFDNKDFFEVWYDVLLGTDHRNLYPSSRNNIKEVLNLTLQNRLETLLEELEINIPLSFSTPQYIEKIIDIFSKYKVHNNGFYPQGISKFRGLTCAGYSMMVSHLLTRKKVRHFYSRPIGHSVNIIVEEGQTYWLDAHNGVYDNIQGEFTRKGAFSTLEIITRNPKIDYKFALLLKPSETYYQIFGNMEHLKESNESNLLKEELQKLRKVNLNEVNDFLFPEIKKYMTEDKQYNLEVTRKRAQE
jgi:hypothetical protein